MNTVNTGTTGTPAPDAGDPPSTAEPLFRITSGQPTDDELAAVGVLLLAIARSRNSAAAPVRQAGGWADPALRLRRPPPPGPGAWRAAVWS